ncbi:MAG: hypothetical protein K9L89_03360 [Kiritimatiellales bacterium]|nr:hypothetical protein [Kiritimatiellales bacterium]
MKKLMLALIMIIACSSVLAGQVGAPLERIAFPATQGSHLVCIWDQSAGNWLRDFETYGNQGSYSFQVPEWGKWYWIGLWDVTNGRYVFGKWIGHFMTN